MKCNHCKGPQRNALYKVEVERGVRCAHSPCYVCIIHLHAAVQHVMTCVDSEGVVIVSYALRP